jgi:hypothetical protein
MVVFMYVLFYIIECYFLTGIDIKALLVVFEWYIFNNSSYSLSFDGRWMTDFGHWFEFACVAQCGGSGLAAMVWDSRSRLGSRWIDVVAVAGWQGLVLAANGSISEDGFDTTRIDLAMHTC